VTIKNKILFSIFIMFFLGKAGTAQALCPATDAQKENATSNRCSYKIVALGSGYYPNDEVIKTAMAAKGYSYDDSGELTLGLLETSYQTVWAANSKWYEQNYAVTLARIHYIKEKCTYREETHLVTRAKTSFMLRFVRHKLKECPYESYDASESPQWLQNQVVKGISELKPCGKRN
jgi:hypothetical protein